MLATTNYQSSSFEKLIEEGRYSEAIQLRLESIASTAHETRKELEASKIINAGAMVAGCVLGFGNPLMLFLGGISGAFYAASLFQDWTKSRKICLLPMSRSGLFEMAGSAASGGGKTRNPIEEVTDYIEPSIATEYLLLQLQEGAMCRYLAQFQPHERSAAYRLALRRSELTEEYYLPSVQEAKQSIAVPISPTADRSLPAPMKAAISEPPIDRPLPASTSAKEPVDLWQADDRSAEPELEPEAIDVPSMPIDRAPQWKPAPAVTSKPKVEGCRILDEVVASTRSTVFASATGTGKSVSQSYILTQLAVRYPDADVWAIGQKNDSYCGLREAGRARVFDAFDPEEAFDVLDIVWDEFDRRKKTPEDDRDKFKPLPVRLILSDWHSIWGTIKDSKFYKEIVKAKLSTLVTVGREMNVCLIVDTQSYNVSSLGLVEDANIRANLNILCQGYVWQDEEGNDRGDYAMIENLLKNRYLVQDPALAQNFDRMVAKSQEQQTPIIFTTIGRSPRLELLPDLRKFKQSASDFKQAPVAAVKTEAKTTVDDISGAMMAWARSLDHMPTDAEVEAWYVDRQAQQAPTASPGTSTIGLLTNWAIELAEKLHRVPTDDELRQKYQMLTGKALNDQGLAVIRGAIDDENGEEEAIAL